MKKKMLAFLMAVLIVVGIFPVTAMAKDQVAKIGDVGYSTLAEAIEAVKSGETIELLKDVTLTNFVTVNKDVVIDGKGHTLNRTGVAANRGAFDYEGMNNGITHSLTVKNLTVKNTSGNSGYVVVVGKGAEKAPEIVIDNCKLENLYCAVIANGCNGTVAPKITLKDNEFTNVTYGISSYQDDYTDEIVVDGNTGIEAEKMFEFAVAKIGKKYYTTLAAAIDAVKDNEIITMVANVVGAHGISVSSGKNFTVDFDGHTYSTEKPGAGSAGTKTQAFQLLKDSTITFKNGTISCTEGNKNATWTSDSAEKGVAMLIQNYCDLTLDNMTIDGTNIAHNGTPGTVRYVVSNNCGTTTIKNSTITAAAGDFAFDSCKYADYTAPTVNVEGSTITGKVEASGGAINFENGTTVNGQVRVGENKNGGATGSVVTIEKGATVTKDEYPVVVFGNNTLNVYGKVESTSTSSTDTAAISTNGNQYNAGSKINIFDGAEIKSTKCSGIYLPNGELDIKGGTIIGETAVYFKSTNLSISGGTLEGTGAKADYTFNGNGGNPTGDALVIDNCNYPSGINAPVITGGTFKSTNANAVGSYAGNGQNDPLTSFITGGTFSSEPTTTYIKNDYFAKKLSDNEWKVEPKAKVVEVPGEETKVEIGGEPVTVEGIGDGTEKPTAGQAVEAINEALANTAVTTENAKDLKEKINTEIVGGIIVDSEVRVELKTVDVEKADNGATITEMVFDVKPIAVFGTGNEQVIPNSAIKAPITFRLPVSSNIGDNIKWAAVYHEGKFMGNYEIKGDATTGKYIEISSKEFSKFGYVLVDPDEAIAKVDDVPYRTLGEAVEKASGKTITVLKDTDETVIVERAMSFKLVVADDVEFTGAIKPGDHYRRYIDGNKYTFRYYETGDPIVIGGNRNKDTKTETKEENPDTGAPVMSMGALVVLAAAYVATRKH